MAACVWLMQCQRGGTCNAPGKATARKANGNRNRAALGRCAALQWDCSEMPGGATAAKQWQCVRSGTATQCRSQRAATVVPLSANVTAQAAAQAAPKEMMDLIMECVELQNKLIAKPARDLEQSYAKQTPTTRWPQPRWYGSTHPQPERAHEQRHVGAQARSMHIQRVKATMASIDARKLQTRTHTSTQATVIARVHAAKLRAAMEREHRHKGRGRTNTSTGR